MKRVLLITITLSMTFVVFGQYQNLPVRTNGSTKAKAIANPHPGGNITQLEHPAIPIVAGFRDLEEEIGTTNFDIQSIASLGRRIGEPTNGTISAAWQMSFVQPGFDDRGTGHNHFDGSSWGPNPTDQVESSRSGYPSYTVMENRTEVVISHKALPAGWQLIAYTKAVDESTWTEHILPSDVPGGNVWAKIAAGGSDGNSLHVVGITLNPSFGGVEHKGMMNHPLYWRSTDGGQTWDKQDFVLPGVDSTKYLTMGAESYSIEARNETVAVSITGIFGDIVVVKSEDNGGTWENHLVFDFPLDKWNGETYTAADLPPDPNAPDPLTTLSSDGSGSMAIDDNGDVHLFYALLYANGNPVDTGIYINLGTNGIAYWNEATGNLSTITGAEDLDGDQEITLGGDIGNYRYSSSGLASFPSASIDEDGNIYLVYMAFNELFTDGDGLTYRHLFIIKSVDGGETWSTPYDLINEDVTEEPGFVEAAYPSIPPHTGDAIQLIYQQDYIPGLTATGVEVPDQYIMHVSLNKETFAPTTETKQAYKENFFMSIHPNPVHGLVQVGFELTAPAIVQLSIYDMLGQQVGSKQIGSLPIGAHRTVLVLNDLSAGVYLMKMMAGEQSSVKKLVVD